MNLEEMVKDSFETMPERLETSGLDCEFKTRIGFEIGAQVWTVEVEGGSCRVRPSLSGECEAIVRTGSQEWIDVASDAIEPTALFLAGKLRVEGDIERLLTAFGLFGSYASDELDVKDPSWIVDTLALVGLAVLCIVAFTYPETSSRPLEEISPER